MITVDIWSDVACPWCFIGKRRFEAGLRQFLSSPEAVGVGVTYELHSFELSPDSPLEAAISVVDYLSRRKGTPRAQVEQMLAHVTSLAAAEGLRFDFGSVQQTRTLRAHELLHLAKAHDLQLATSEALFSAFFEDGRNVGDIAVLADLAERVGIDRGEALDCLATGRYRAAVAADIEQARAYGISAVPFFVIDGRYGLAGAHAPATFAAALGRAALDRVSLA